MFPWSRKRRRAELLAEPFPTEWAAYLAANVRHYAYLDPPRRTSLQQVVRVLAAEKNWVGGSGLELTDEMKVTVAGQAAVLGLGMAEPYFFDRVQSLFVYPDTYRSPAGRQSGSWIVHEGQPLSGEAWHRGPIVLSWAAVLAAGRNASQGHNLVFHEFAHHLDDLDGAMDGTPPLADRQQARAWYRVTEQEYLRLVGEARRDAVSLLDHYGATNRAEFFAVATECFFERPRALRARHAELYGVLRDFFRQDPAGWLPDAVLAGSGSR